MQTIYLDISHKGVVPKINAKQGDIGRKFLAIINDSGLPYPIPEDASVSVWYQTFKNNNAGATGGVSFEDNKIEITIDPAITQVSGEGILCLTISFSNGDVISTWNIPYDVEIKPGTETIEPSVPGVQTTAVLYTPQTLTAEHQLQACLNIGAAMAVDVENEIDRLDEAIGKIATAGGGLTDAEKTLFLSLFKNAAYTADMSATIAQLETLWSSEEPDEPVTPDVTLTSISATYSGGNVPAGTAVSSLAGVKVTAHYSDGSTATVTGYTLSGTIKEGANTITVSYGGKTTTFTVTGVADESGSDTEVTLTSISATYTGGDVPSGTPLSDLTGIEVTAHYSDGTTEIVTDYSLSGAIGAGNNTITVTYNGMTTTFAVTGTVEVEEGLLHKWDFTQSLSDIAGDADATIPNKDVSAVNFAHNDAYRDESGIHIETGNDFVRMCGVFGFNRTYEIDFGDVDAQYGTSAHGRLFTVMPADDIKWEGHGLLIYRCNTVVGWQAYSGTNASSTGSWHGSVIADAVDAFANKTVKISVDADGYAKYYVDGELIFTATRAFEWGTDVVDCTLGSYSTSAYNTIIKGMRIYEGVR